MKKFSPISHSEEILACQIGDHLCQYAHGMLQKGIPPAQIEASLIEGLSKKEVNSAIQPHRNIIDAVRRDLQEVLIEDLSLAVPHFMGEFVTLAGLRPGQFRLPSELVWLMDALTTERGENAFCPFSLSLQSAVIATRRFQSVSFQDNLLSGLHRALCSVFHGLHFYEGDPLDGRPIELPVSLDCVVSAPPLAQRITPARCLRSVKSGDSTTTNGELARLDLLLPSPFKRLVALSSRGFLAGGNRLEDMFKSSLLKTGILEAVIQLPVNLIPGTRWNPSLLVLGAKRDKNSPVCLMDASDGFHESRKGRFTQSRLKDWRAIISSFETEGKHVQHLSGDFLAKNGYDFTPKRYLHNISTAKAESTFEPLGQLVQNFRGQVWPRAHRLAPDEIGPDENFFHEAAVHDIGSDGVLNRPTKRFVYTSPLSSTQEKLRLQSGDILFSCKGSVGKIALVPAECENNWVPSQSFQILRPLPDTDSIVLFHLLRSKALQKKIAQLVTGSTVPQIKVADMTKLPIPIISNDECAKLHTLHEEVLNISREIAKMEEKRSLILRRLWSE